MIVVSDTGPIHYLLLTDLVWLLPELFGEIWITPKVVQELQHPNAPEAIRKWGSNSPGWIVWAEPVGLVQTTKLDAGELEAISLAFERGGILLKDDLRGYKICPGAWAQGIWNTRRSSAGARKIAD